MLLEEADEIKQSWASTVQLESETASQGEVFLNSLSQGVHRTPPGHGAASVRSASRSTLV